MSSRRFATIVCALVAGCGVDPAIVITLNGRAFSTVELVAPPSAVTDGGSYRWDVIETPEGSAIESIHGKASARLVPDVRGQYLVERWYTLGVGEDLTHRFVVDVLGLPPAATIQALPSSVPINATATIDGSESASAEGLPLTYHWRLAMRPIGSGATIGQWDAQTSLVPDVAGTYVVELTVFDGALWSDAPALVSVNAQ